MINLYEIHEGDRVVLKNGKSGVCTENMGDGQWIEIESESEVILVHSQEVLDVTKPE